MVTPALIKELRERTGVGMAKCKEALEKSQGDIELAIANLRKAGMATAVKKEGRDTNEGMIGSFASTDAVAVVEVNAETDFVVRNDRFQEFALQIAKRIAETQPASLEQFASEAYQTGDEHTVDQQRSTLVQTLGENIQIKRLKWFPKDKNTSIGLYSHLGGKIVTAVVISGSDEEETLAKDIGMHIAAAAPEYLSPETVPEEVLAQEKDIAQSQVQGKPEHILDKIIAGKLDAFYDTNCLLRQHYLKDDSLTIAQLVEKRAAEKGKPLKIVDFIRWNVGQ